jgi:flagellar biosynthesis/type III secretory pathway M-ring protein FliF/YscJ
MTRSTLILAAALVLLVIAGVLIGPAACNRIRSMGAQHRLEQGQNEALANSAADAINTQGAASVREQNSEELTRSNEKEIRNADGANNAVNPAVRDAGLRSLCRRAAYRDSPRCLVLEPTPR